MSGIHRVAAFVVGWLICYAVPGIAQNFPYNIDTRPSRGIFPTADQITSPLDSIDPASRNLHLEIPLASLPPGRGGSGFDLKLEYDSSLYDISPQEDYTIQYGQVTPIVKQAYQMGTTGSWHYNFGYFLLQETRFIPSWDQDCGSAIQDLSSFLEHTRMYRTRLVLPDGSQHILHLRGYGDELGDNYWGDGFYGIDITGKRSFCATPQTGRYPHDFTNGDLTYYTTDGSYLKLVIHADASSVLGTNNTWTLYLPDGTTVKGSGSSSREIDDPNGNAIRIDSGCSESCTHVYLLITDDFGRSIRIETDYSSASRHRQIITTAGPTGTLSWTVDWVPITVGSKNYPCSAGSIDVTCSYVQQSRFVVKSIQLPEGAASDPPLAWNSYVFGYEDSGRWGHLNSMQTPSGAQYTYVNAFDAIASKTITHDGQSDLTWTYSVSAISTSASRTTVTSPDGGQTAYSYYDFLDLKQWRHGLVYQIEEPLGRVTKRVWSQNWAYGLGGTSATWNPNNPFVSKETETIGNASGNPSKTIVREMTIDKNGNTREQKEYDWVNYSVNGIENGLSVVRDTIRNYYVDAPFSNGSLTDSNSYWSDHFPASCGGAVVRLNALRRESTLDGAGATKAATEWDYDCPYTSGNITAEKHWDSTKSASAPGLGGLSGGNSVIFSRAYNSYGNLTDIFEPAIATHLTYGAIPGSPDPGPYPTTVVYAPGSSAARSWGYSWNSETGTLTSKTDNDNGVVTTFTYDLYGRRLTSIEAGMRKSETAYDDENRKVILKNDLNALGDGKLQTITHYDQLGRVVLLRTSDGSPLGSGNSDGIKTSTAYIMASGGTRVVTSTPFRSMEDSTLEWACTQRDLSGRITAVAIFKVAEPSDCESTTNRTGITRSFYDANWAVVTDPAGAARAENRDGLGRLVYVSEDPSYLNYPTFYQYDTLGNLTNVSQPDGQTTQTRTFEYSSLGRLLSATNPENGTIHYTYFDGGDLSSQTDARGVRTSYSYDGLHRMLSKSYSGDGGVTSGVSYSYYAPGSAALNVGQLKSIGSSAATISYEGYDGLGHPRVNSQQIDGNVYTFQYNYRLDDGVSSIQYPSGKTIHYDADDAGRVNRAFAGSRVYADMTVATSPFTADGRIAQMKLGNDLWETRVFRTPGLPTLLKLGTSAGASDKLELEYDYSATANNGNLISAVVRQPGHAWTQSYGYDALNRIASASEAGGFSRTYGYDRFGNRWVASSSGITSGDSHEPTVGTLFDRTNNRLANQSYDAAGNLTSYAPRILAYDAENRMISATSSLNGNESFIYDGEGRRVRKTWTPYGGITQVTTYVYGLNGHVAAEYMNQAPSGATKTSWMFTDMLGSVRAVTAEKPQSGIATITECYDYLPFGRIMSSSDNGRNTSCYPTSPDYSLPSVESQKFTGKERDIETGLDYFSARYYSGAQGRFLSPDPILSTLRQSNPQSLNRYAYTLNDPLRYVDPTGTYEEDVHRDLTAVLALAVGFDAETALAIGRADQAVDEDKRGPFNSVDARSGYHFTTADRRSTLWAGFQKSGTVYDLGAFLHAEQDSYSHEGFGPRLGHASAWTAPDKTYNDAPKADKMANDSYSKLLLAANRLGILNNSVSFASIENYISSFNRARSDREKQEILAKMKFSIEQTRKDQNDRKLKGVRK